MNRAAQALPAAALAILLAVVIGLSDSRPAVAQDIQITEMSMGDADAPVEVIEYASFTCPHCASFHALAFKPFKSEYIDTGKVHFIYREVFFANDRPALWASLVARCTGPNRFFPVVDLIFQRQGDWTSASGGQEMAAALRRIGLSAGMSEDELDACMQDGPKAQALSDWAQQNVQGDGIEGTPAFVIAGRTYSVSEIAELSDFEGRVRSEDDYRAAILGGLSAVVDAAVED